MIMITTGSRVNPHREAIFAIESCANRQQSPESVPESLPEPVPESPQPVPVQTPAPPQPVIDGGTVAAEAVARASGSYTLTGDAVSAGWISVDLSPTQPDMAGQLVQAIAGLHDNSGMQYFWIEYAGQTGSGWYSFRVYSGM